MTTDFRIRQRVIGVFSTRATFVTLLFCSEKIHPHRRRRGMRRAHFSDPPSRTCA